MPKKNNSDFWDSFAAKYDGFIHRFAKKTYLTIEKCLKEDLQKTDRVLELGTGTGLIAFAVTNNVREIIAIDSAAEMINIANGKLAGKEKNNIAFQLGNATRTGFPDNFFDVVIASNVFHLLESPELSLQEIRRILKDSGKAILPTYCHGQNIKTRIISAFMGLSGFRAVNRWSVKSFRKFLEKEGFTVLREEIIKDKIPLSYIVLKKQKL